MTSQARARTEENEARRFGYPLKAKRDIRTTLGSVGSQLTGDLAYTPEEAERILVLAVADSLDERFHVTDRERWFG